MISSAEPLDADLDLGPGLHGRPYVASRLCLRDERADRLAGDGSRWLGPTTAEDDAVLERAVAPVLDIGCGPGRHLLALARRGIVGLGLDLTPSAVVLARSRGVEVMEGSVYGAAPRPGTWATALLLDGTIGIGGDPAALLIRVAELLQPGGNVLVELGPPGVVRGAARARLDHDGRLGPWFEWTTVSSSDVSHVAAAAFMTVRDAWSEGGRWLRRSLECLPPTRRSLTDHRL